MPFVNVNGDPNTEYLADGLRDSIINNLSQLPSLKKVIALNSLVRDKEKQTDPQTVGREMNVLAVLVARLIQHGDDLSINVELVDVRDNKRLWGQQYDRKLAEITMVQTEIAHEISEKLRLRLTGEEQKHLTKKYTESGEAYQLYLTGRYFQRKATREGLEKGVELFEQAIKRDPNFAPAYAGLAGTYGTLGLIGVLPPKETAQKQEWALRKALDIDNDLAEAHSVKAYVAEVDLNWSASEQENKRALGLNPNSAIVHVNYTYYLLPWGRFDEAMLHLKRAQELDPLSLNIAGDIRRAFYFSRQFDRAIDQFQKS